MRIIARIGHDFGQLIHRLRCRRRRKQSTGIDNAAAAYSHAVFTQEIQTAADLTVLDSVDRAVDIYAAIDKIDQLICLVTVGLIAEIHIGDLIGVQFEFIKNIDARTFNDFSCRNIGNIILSSYLGKICTGGDLGRCCQRIGKDPQRGNCRYDLPGQPVLMLLRILQLSMILFVASMFVPSLRVHEPAPF